MTINFIQVHAVNYLKIKLKLLYLHYLKRGGNLPPLFGFIS
jgi:hypothetical protein